ncbi:MAG: amidohydrolase family protein [Actinomycetales bacterium]|nr:amidohydrolase family protein [Actinomycetales bacterium]
MLSSGEVRAIVNARTVDPVSGRGAATALLIRDGRIELVADDASVLRRLDSLAREGTVDAQPEVIDARQASILPGFIDGHCHFELTCTTADGWVHAHTPPLQSLAQVLEVVRQSTDRPRGDWDWLLCRSSFSMERKVQEGRLLTREELDGISTDRPIAVFASLHVASLNTPALKRLGLWEPGARHPFHGVVHRDARGVPTGVVTEVFMMVPPPVTADGFAEAVMAHGRDMFNAAGTTTVLTMPENLDQVERLRDLHRAGQMTLRQQYYLISPGVATLDEASELRRIDETDESFRFGGIKVFVNGCAHDGMGAPLDDVKWSQDELDAFVQDAARRDMQVWMHSLNANGVRMAARAMLSADPTGQNRLRHRIEHGGDFIDLDDLPLIAASGALLVTTPQFLHSMTTDPIGPTAPLRSLLAAGIRLVGGTDSTGTVPASVSVLGNVGTAVSRRRNDGTRFHPAEAITTAQALALFTQGAAYGGHLEQVAGSLHRRAYADLVLVDHDPLAPDAPAPEQIAVLAAYVAGERVWTQPNPASGESAR